MARRPFFLCSINFETLSQLVAMLFVVVPLCAGDSTVSRSRFLMGTTCTIEADLTPSQLGEAFQEIGRVEALISTWRADSVISRLNGATSAATLDREVFNVIEEAARWCALTDGAFNPLVGPLIEAWKLRDGGQLPDHRELQAAVLRSRPQNLQLDPSAGGVVLLEGAQLEEGGFGKGYAIDRALETMRSFGAREFVVDFGGQLAIDSTASFEVSIAHPERRQIPIASLSVRRGSISTSSGSERTFETPEGPRSHIIDPRSGQALSPMGSVTVIHESAMAADVLSTALYVMGSEQGLRWAEENEVAAIFIVPGKGAWDVLTSSAANNPGFELKTIDADFHLKGKH